jgi:hypothetical protein
VNWFTHLNMKNPRTNDYIFFVNRKQEIYFQFKTFPNRFRNRKRLWLKCIRFLKNLEFRTSLWINYGLEKNLLTLRRSLLWYFVILWFHWWELNSTEDWSVLLHKRSQVETHPNPNQTSSLIFTQTFKHELVWQFRIL